MDIQSLDTNKLLYDISKQSEMERLFKDVPAFANEEIGNLSRTKVTKYVVLMYDFESPLRKEYQKIRERKSVAARHVGFSLEGGHFKKNVEEMTVGKCDGVNRMIIKYLFLFNDPNRVALEVYVNMLENRAARALLTQDDVKEDKTTFDLIEKLRGVIDELNQRVFGGQDDEALIKELYRNIETIREKTQPEYVAKLLRDGGDIGYNPYGEWQPEPLKLIPSEEEIFKAED